MLLFFVNKFIMEIKKLPTFGYYLSKLKIDKGKIPFLRVKEFSFCLLAFFFSSNVDWFPKADSLRSILLVQRNSAAARKHFSTRSSPLEVYCV